MGSLIRLIKSFFYYFTGRVDNVRKGIESDPTAMRAQFDSIIKEKAASAKTFMEAVAGLMNSEETKRAKHKDLVKQINELAKMKQSALSKAQERANKLKMDGKTPEEIKADATYIKHTAAYKDFSSTMEEKEKYARDLEAEVDGLSKQVSTYKTQLAGVQREIDNLRAESNEAIADIAAAKEQEKIANALSSITNFTKDSSGEALSSLREARQKAKNQAKIVTELAETTVTSQHSEYAKDGNDELDDELDRMIFGNDEIKSDVKTEVKESSKLPE